MSMNQLSLHGCTPEPLMNYLKALGVLRIVAEQVDPAAKGCWRNGVFQLHTNLAENELLDFFVSRYAPSPIVSPWNGDGGFLSETGSSVETIRQIEQSTDPRLESLQVVIRAVKQVGALREFGKNRERAKELEKKKKEKTITEIESEELAIVNKRVKAIKNDIVTNLRNNLPDTTQVWLDACLVIDLDGFAAAPVLGSGGVDGRMEFSANFLGNILTLFNARESGLWFEKALFDRGDAVLLETSIGQFAPGRIGGPNATQGMEGNSMLNPCDYLLMLEGVLMLGGSVARRLGQRSDAKAAFPFTVRAASAGHGSLADSEAREARGELWLPLWERPTSLAEIKVLFTEGRAELSGRQSRTAVDFARAVASLGIDRGINSFSRQGFLKRNGLAFLATPLGRFDVRARESVDLIREIDSWLTQFRMACGEDAPGRFRTVAKGIENAIFDYCRYGGREQFGQILRALGRAEKELANGESFRKDRKTGQTRIRPLCGLSSDWIEAADDGSAEFRLALSLAAMYDREAKVGPLRANLEPIDWTQRYRTDWATKDRRVVWNSSDLSANLTAVLQRRLMDANRLGCTRLPLESTFSVPLDAVSAFMHGEVNHRPLDEQRLEEWLWGLTLIDHRPFNWKSSPALFETLPLPRAYALLKLLFLPAPLRITRTDSGAISEVAFAGGEEEGHSIATDPRIVPLLRSGRPNSVGDACRIAAQRLRNAGLQPLPHRRSGGPNRDTAWAQAGSGIDGNRLAASLLYPISTRSIVRLLNLVTRPEEESADAENDLLTSVSEF